MNLADILTQFRNNVNLFESVLCLLSGDLWNFLEARMLYDKCIEIKLWSYTYNVAGERTFLPLGGSIIIAAASKATLMPTAHTSDIIGPSLVGGSVHIAEGLWSFPIYTHTLTMMRSNRARLELGNVSCH